MNELGGLGVHFEPEPRQPPSAFREKVQEIPLRHDCDVLAAPGHVTEVGSAHESRPDHTVELTQLRMRELQEVVEEAELVEYLQRRRMHRIAAKVAVEIGVSLDDEHLDAGAGQEVAEHEPGRPAADNAAVRLHFSQHGLNY